MFSGLGPVRSCGGVVGANSEFRELSLQGQNIFNLLAVDDGGPAGELPAYKFDRQLRAEDDARGLRIYPEIIFRGRALRCLRNKARRP